MITKEQDIKLIWETDNIEQLRDFSVHATNINLSTLFRQLYNATIDLRETYQKLTPEQKNDFRKQIASTLISDKVADVPDPEFISTSDVSKILGISPQAVRKWCETKKLEAKRTFGDYGEWKIYTEQFKRNEEMASKYRVVMVHKKEKQLRTHSALNNLDETNFPEYKEFIEGNE